MFASYSDELTKIKVDGDRKIIRDVNITVFRSINILYTNVNRVCEILTSQIDTINTIIDNQITLLRSQNNRDYVGDVLRKDIYGIDDLGSILEIEYPVVPNYNEVKKAVKPYNNRINYYVQTISKLSVYDILNNTPSSDLENCFNYMLKVSPTSQLKVPDFTKSPMLTVELIKWDKLFDKRIEMVNNVPIMDITLLEYMV